MKINKLIVHCSGNQANPKLGAADVKFYHVKERGYADIGYHYVITQGGKVEKGRPDTSMGAHTQGHNADSLGICLIGGIDKQGKPEKNFTQVQYDALAKLLKALIREHPQANVYGHNDFNKAKPCPCFDVQAWWKAQNA